MGDVHDDIKSILNYRNASKLSVQRNIPAHEYDDVKVKM
jgi:hypothetical protein